MNKWIQPIDIVQCIINEIYRRRRANGLFLWLNEKFQKCEKPLIYVETAEKYEFYVKIAKLYVRNVSKSFIHSCIINSRDSFVTILILV